MFSNDLQNSYTYEVERRRDEMHAAAQIRLAREDLGNRRHVALPVTGLSILMLLLAILINH
jgi:hypothetical protein